MQGPAGTNSSFLRHRLPLVALLQTSSLFITSSICAATCSLLTLASRRCPTRTPPFVCRRCCVGVTPSCLWRPYAIGYVLVDTQDVLVDSLASVVVLNLVVLCLAGALHAVEFSAPLHKEDYLAICLCRTRWNPQVWAQLGVGAQVGLSFGI